MTLGQDAIDRICSQPLSKDMAEYGGQIREAFRAFHQNPGNRNLNDMVYRRCASYCRTLAWEAGVQGDAKRIGDIRGAISSVEDLDEIKGLEESAGPFAEAVASARGAVLFMDRLRNALAAPAAEGLDVGGLRNRLLNALEAFKSDPQGEAAAQAVYAVIEETIAASLQAVKRLDRHPLDTLCDLQRGIPLVKWQTKDGLALATMASLFYAVRSCLVYGQDMIKDKRYKQSVRDPQSREHAALRVLASVNEPQEKTVLPLTAREILALMPAAMRGDLKPENIYSFMQDFAGRGFAVHYTSQVMWPGYFYLAPAGYRMCKELGLPRGGHSGEVRAARRRAEEVLLDILNRAQPAEKDLRQVFLRSPHPLRQEDIEHAAQNRRETELVFAHLRVACSEFVDTGLIINEGYAELDKRRERGEEVSHTDYIYADHRYTIAPAGRAHLAQLQAPQQPPPEEAPEAEAPAP